MKKVFFPAFFLLIALIAGDARASYVLDFEGLQNSEEVLNYYNGGFGLSLSGPGPNYGIYFSAGAAVVIDPGAGGASANTFLMSAGNPFIATVASGFTSDFSFHYFSQSVVQVDIYDAAYGMGNHLASMTFPGNSGGFSWDLADVPFSGTAHSVKFSGPPGLLSAFDNLTFGDASEVPIPGAVWLLGSGLAGLMGVRRFRRG